MILTPTILFSSILLTTLGYQEAPCRNAGGYCRYSWSCPGKNYRSGLCPTQSRWVKCCFKAPYQEAPCRSAGGTCTDKPCTSGTTLRGKCPTQPAKVLCCKKNKPPLPPITNTLPSCSSLDGTCQSYRSCSGLVVGGICPGSSSIRCCISSIAADNYEKHLSKTEGGMYLRGYIPTSGSGVTIATGVDLGQQNLNSLPGMSAALTAKVSPYLGKKTKAAVYAAGLNEKNLILTLDEARFLDQIFKNGALRRIAPYVRNMDERGKVVMVSLVHWCYNVWDKRADAKCYHKNCPNYLRNALISQTATNQSLKNALIQQRDCLSRLGQSSFKISRLNAEINYL